VLCHSGSSLLLLCTGEAAEPAASDTQPAPPAELLLLTQSRQLAPAAQHGLSSGPTVVLAPGSNASSSGCGGRDASTDASGLFAACVRLVGAEAAAAAGSSLLYCTQPGGSQLGYLNAGNSLSAGAAPRTVLDLDAADSPLLVAAATAHPPAAPPRPLLVCLTRQGRLLAAGWPAPAAPGSSCAAAAAADLEGEVQVRSVPGRAA
jgi:hypothetical protein